MTSIINGGCRTRWALEHHPELYDDGVDWEGTLFRPQINLFTFLPAALQHYPVCDHAARPTAVKDAVQRVPLTGRVRRPMLTARHTGGNAADREGQ